MPDERHDFLKTNTLFGIQTYELPWKVRVNKHFG